MRLEKTTCRSCHNNCPVNVTIDGGTVVKVTGNPDAPLYEGFICPKGTALAAYHNDIDRLEHHLKRLPDGRYVPISSEQLADEISIQLKAIIERHGPDAVASFMGGASVEHPAMQPMIASFLQAIGSSSFYSTGTLDQPGLMIADALHGRWAGGHPHQDQLEALVLVGTNPVISKQSLGQNAGMILKNLVKNGMKLIVIDPRRTETARRAHIFLQCIPGEDPTIIAGLLHLIVARGGVDRSFVDRNAEGFDELADVLGTFTPAYVAKRAGISEADLIEAADVLIKARTGAVWTGVGPSMATRGSLTSYLCRCVQTLRGFWPSAGDKVARARVLLPKEFPKAQPSPPTPAWGFGRTLRTRGLQMTAAGMPTGALVEEILTPGEGQVRAVFMHAGAILSWPQTELTRRALESLDLLVVFDIERNLSPTARSAHYVIATTLQFETSVTTQFWDIVSHFHSGYGWAEPYAAYHPAIMPPPAGSDVLEPWQIYYRVAQKLGMPLHCGNPIGSPESWTALDMENEPSTDDLYAFMCKDSAVPLSEVRKFPDGKVFSGMNTVVGPADPDCTARLQLADPTMVSQLRAVADEKDFAAAAGDHELPYLFIPRRILNAFNGTYRPKGLLKKTYNPAYLHSSDLAQLGLVPGDKVEIRSRHGAIVGFVDIDDDLRPGVLSMCHAFGRHPADRDYDPRRDGSNVNQLLHWHDDYDPYHGMPRMGAVPVAVRRIEDA